VLHVALTIALKHLSNTLKTKAFLLFFFVDVLGVFFGAEIELRGWIFLRFPKIMKYVRVTSSGKIADHLVKNNTFGNYSHIIPAFECLEIANRIPPNWPIF